MQEALRKRIDSSIKAAFNASFIAVPGIDAGTANSSNS
jgi:hypothetical protein